jgi:uncharacterized protein
LKFLHEVRDPIYGFIHFDSLERDIINSMPFQRLRNIHQLALTSLIYPAATHKRFEHSLGVMEVTSDVYDRVFREESMPGPVAEILRRHLQGDRRGYWRRVIRIAALLHDVGHLPFSHAAEKELLPTGWDHERMTAEMIRNSEIAEILKNAEPPINVEDVIDLAWEPSKRAKHEPNRMPDVWRTLLNEIITGDTFGTDRVDYLQRDAYHAGVAYGGFDVHRLIGGLRVHLDESDNPVLAIELGSIHAAEALLLARYFMYTQVYMHRLRRVYDEHLKDFMAAWLRTGRFTEEWQDMLAIDDNKVFAAMWHEATRENGMRQLADRIVRRKHFKSAYELNPQHKRLHPPMVDDAFNLLVERYGKEAVRKNVYTAKAEASKFRVVDGDGKLAYGDQVSPDVIGRLPVVDIGFVFVEPDLRDEAHDLVVKQFSRVYAGNKMSRRRK